MEQGKKYFYKYVPKNKYWESNLEALLKDNLLTFVSPCKFNDPYDCRVVPKMTGGSESDWREYFTVWFYKNNKEGKNILAIGEAVEKEMKRESYKNPKLVDEYRQIWVDSIELLMKQYFISSMTLSERPEKMLLWSHYASQHTGFCFQFAYEPFVVKEGCMEVKYIHEFPEFHELIEALKDDDKLAKMSFAIKADDWAYEKEWRLVWHNKNAIGNNAVRGEIPQNALLSIILGSMIDNKIRETIIKMASKHRPDINIYTAVLKKNEFGFDFKIVNAGE